MKLPELLARAAYWSNQRVRGRASIHKRLEWLREAQWLPPEDIRTLQWEKLRTILDHAYRTVPYYRQIMQENGITPVNIDSPNDLRKLPLLTRDVLRRQQADLLSTEADHRTLHTNFSSGSTGVRAEFKQDLNFKMWMRAHQLRTYEWCANWRLGQPFALLWGSEIYWSLRRISDKIDNAISNRREFNTFRLSNDLIRKFLETLTSFQPTLISSYASAILLLACEAEQRRIRIPALRAVQGTSEPMPLPFRQRIANAFFCEVYDKYGMRETNIVCHESPNHEEMCVQAENVYVEVLNEEGEPCAAGERGRIVVTTLNNLSMPLIRYETSDLAAPLDGYCSSGIGLPRMTSVVGRKQDLIVSPKGDYIDAYLFSYLLMRFSEVLWFQVIQKEIEELTIRLYAPHGLNPSKRREIVERIHHHTGFRFEIDFEVYSSMPESPTGKFRLCVSGFANGGK